MNTGYPFTGYNTGVYAMPQYQNTVFQPATQPMQAPHMEIPRVSGKESIMSYPMGPDSSAIFVSSDPNSDLGWVVTTDSAAYKTIAPCRIIPYVEEQPVKASDLENRFAKIEERFNNIEERINSNGQYGSKSSESNNASKPTKSNHGDA